MIQEDNHIFKGLRRDNHPIRQESQYLWDARNIRLTARDGNTTLSITNEKGTKNLLDLGRDIYILSHCIVGHWLVIFKKINRQVIGRKETTYSIERLNLDEIDNNPSLEVLYKDKNLKFGTKVQSISDYESEFIQKVYWVDGINQVRLINVAYPELSDNKENYWNRDLQYYDFTNLYNKLKVVQDDPFIPFDFTPELNLQEEVSIEREHTISMFPSGVIQYICTYYNKYGQETNPFYISPLLNISSGDIGSKEDSTCSVGFKINIRGLHDIDGELDYHFNYIRVYSILKTSINGDSVTKRVADIPIEKTYDTEGNVIYKTNEVSILDVNTSGESVDTMSILYLGGKVISANTLKSKDNILFLGNITEEVSSAGNIKLDDGSSLKDNIYNRVNNFIESDDSDRTLYQSYRNVGEPGGSDSTFYSYKSQLSFEESTVTFKYRETYRLGIQLQHKSGVWSEPIWVMDYVVNKNPANRETLVLPTFIVPVLDEYTKQEENNEPFLTRRGLFDDSVLEIIRDNGYKSIRPLIVKPSISDRTILCQGILNPTVFSVGGRKNNSPHAQSSWLFRPMFLDNGDPNAESKAEDITNLVKRGAAVTSLHYTNIAQCTINHSYRGQEIQNGWNFNAENGAYPLYNSYGFINSLSEETTYNVYSEADGIITSSKVINNVTNSSIFNNFFYSDRSILTFHSPDIEFDESLQNNLEGGEWKLRLVGLIPFTSSSGDINIRTDSAPLSAEAKGFTRYMTYSNQGYRHLVSGLFYNDTIFNNQDSTGFHTQWMVYMWNMQGSLNNDRVRQDGSDRTSVLKKKVISNLLYAEDNIWFNFPLEVPMEQSCPKIFNSNEVELIKIPDSYNVLGSISYYGNIDELLTTSTEHYCMVGVTTKPSNLFITPDQFAIKTRNNSSDLINEYSQIKSLYALNRAGTINHNPPKYIDISPESIRKLEPVRMKYKSTPHAVLATAYKQYNLNSNIGNTSDTQNVLLREPLPGIPGEKLLFSGAGSTKANLFWLENEIGLSSNNLKELSPVLPDTYIKQSQLNENYGYLYLAELYNDSREHELTIYGGKSNEGLLSNQWIIAGDTINIEVAKRYYDSGSPYYVTWKWGDTWYQRYDCLKTYPFTEEDENQVVEIGSFMCETRVNIDGRTDKNRGQVSNLNIRPTNFNLINKVYSQLNTFFTYQILPDDYYKSISYPSRIIWSQAKIPSATIDLWTNIDTINSLDLNSSFGKLNSIESYNDLLLSFQDTCISQILFNSRVQLNPSDNVPIEINNSGRVDGSRIISSSIGCQDNVSIITSPVGVYFVDKQSDTAYLYNGEGIPINLSMKLGNMYWFRDNHDNVISLYYDPSHRDVYYVTPDDALCFSETLGQFESTFDYGNSHMFSYNGRMFASHNVIKSNNLNYPPGASRSTPYYLYEMFKGDKHCNIFDSNYPFEFSFISNDNPNITKVFDTLYLSGDKYKDGILDSFSRPIDYIEVSNEYQETDEVELDNTNFRKKFRIWRGLIPRASDTSHGIRNKLARSRIRNPWTKIKLKGVPHDDSIDELSIIHNVGVKYTI